MNFSFGASRPQLPLFVVIPKAEVMLDSLVFHFPVVAGFDCDPDTQADLSFAEEVPERALQLFNFLHKTRTKQFRNGILVCILLCPPPPTVRFLDHVHDHVTLPEGEQLRIFRVVWLDRSYPTLHRLHCCVQVVRTSVHSLNALFRKQMKSNYLSCFKKGLSITEMIMRTSLCWLCLYKSFPTGVLSLMSL